MNELEVAIKAARAAGERLEYYFETVLEHEEKDDTSLVTKADSEADEIITQKITEEFPDHNILSEEAGDLGRKSDYCWVIDPLDGTLNFTRGLPIFAVSVALVKNEEIVLSVVYNPITNSLFHAEKGKGAFWNEEKIRVSDRSELSKAIIGFGRARDEEAKKETVSKFNNIYFKSHQRVLGSSALELAWVASGRLDGFFGVGLKNWDVAGGLLLVTESGGRITEYKKKEGKLYFLASNPQIHQELLSLTGP